MPSVVLTEEQARVLRQSQGPVDVRDEQGRPIASMSLLTPDDLEAIERYKRRKAEGRNRPPIPAAKVREHLQRLAEIRDREGLDEPKMLELLRRMQAGEEV